MRYDRPENVLRVLILEDVPTDAELVEDELRGAGIVFVSVRVDSEEAFLNALDVFSPDIILSDYSLPSFDGESALSLASEKVPGAPFIFVTGALGEERAVDLLKSGATDFVLKERLPRLPLCVGRALEEAEEKRARFRAEEELRQAHSELEREVEERTSELRHTLEALRKSEEQLRRAHNELELRVRERTAELSTAVARLELMNQELQEFAFVAAHDLQEPLRKIQTYCDLAQKRCSPALDLAGQDYLDKVVSSAARMRQLLDELLQYSRVAARLAPFKEVDLGQTLREAACLFEERIKACRGSIEIGNMPSIQAEETQMLLLFENLIGNALKFRGADEPRIEISSALDAHGYCEITVRDNGIGFDQQFEELIFKPFQKLHTRERYAGTGMGLAICRKIVERHSGNIRAESRPGEGSTFIIRLPVKQERPEGF